MRNDKLTSATKSYYDDLISQVGETYVDMRWGDHPLKRSHYRQTEAAIVSALHDYASHCRSLLEIGCGPGIWTDFCLQCSERVTLLDISAEMLAITRKKYAKNERVQQFLVGDYMELAEAMTDRFDAIFSSRAIEYMSDKRKMVSSSYRLLTDGGTLIIITKNPRWRDKLKEDAASADLLQSGWIAWRDMKEYFLSAGFRNVVVRPVALGSYHRPFNNRIGILMSETISKMVKRNAMRNALNFLTESYIIIGRK